MVCPKLNRLHTRKISICRTIFLLLPTVLLAALTQTGCALTSGNLATSPTSLSFGNVAIGSSRNQTLTVTNAQSETITITIAVASGGGFTVKGSSLPMTLAWGQSTTFITRFAPTAI